jgi:hypothetical protein
LPAGLGNNRATKIVKKAGLGNRKERNGKFKSVRKTISYVKRRG